MSNYRIVNNILSKCLICLILQTRTLARKVVDQHAQPNETAEFQTHVPNSAVASVNAKMSLFSGSFLSVAQPSIYLLVL